MANDIVADAQQKAGQILEAAAAAADKQKSLLGGDIKQEEDRLNYAKKETAQFLASIRAFIDKELKLLDEAPELTFEEPPAVAKDASEEAAQEIGVSVDAAIEEETPAPAPQPAVQAQPEGGDAAPGPAEPTAAVKVAELDFDVSVFDEINGPSAQDTDPPPRFNFDNLQFGKNFSLGKKEKK
jgi:cell division initiation protein